MSFLHFPLLAAGSLLVAVPLVLHLLMRRRPRHALFPALRFVRRTQQQNERRLQLRHWLLLALRCLLIVILAAALARPVVASAALGRALVLSGLAAASLVTGGLAFLWSQKRQAEIASRGLGILAALLLLATLGLAVSTRSAGKSLPQLAGDAPVAAVFLLDTSPRMGLVQESRSRLEVAQELAKTLLRQLPADSRMGWVDSQTARPSFAVDRAAAMRHIDSLQTGYDSRPLPHLLAAALDLLRTCPDLPGELYLFTDLTHASWPPDTRSTLRETLADSFDGQLIVIDVGVVEPRNLRLGDITLSREHVAPQTALRLEVELQSRGLRGARRVELALETSDPDLPMIVDGKVRLPEEQLEGQQEVRLVEGGAQRVEFPLRAASTGTHHGQLRVLGGDGLEADNVRYFTFTVHAPWRILLAHGPGAQPRYLHEALAPYAFRQTGQALFDCDLVPLAELSQQRLDDYGGVGLLDPGEVPAGVWRELETFVAAGGGLAVFLGRNATREALNQPAAQRVLAAPLKGTWRAGQSDLLLTLPATPHPVLDVLRPMATTIPWNELPIYRHWLLDELPEATRVVMQFGHGKPALVEHRLGRGRALLMTTPISDPLNVAGRPAWSSGTDSWPYVVLVNEIFRYLVQGSDARLNYTLGEAARLRVPGNDGERFQLFHPQGSWQEVVLADRELVVPRTDHPGHYRVRGAAREQPPAGFSVNLAAETTQLDRLDRTALDSILGEGNYQLARDEVEVVRDMHVARRGHDFYPWLILLAAFAVALEQLLANRFYGLPSPKTASAVTMPHLEPSS